MPLNPVFSAFQGLTHPALPEIRANFAGGTGQYQTDMGVLAKILQTLNPTGTPTTGFRQYQNNDEYWLTTNAATLNTATLALTQDNVALPSWAVCMLSAGNILGIYYAAAGATVFTLYVTIDASGDLSIAGFAQTGAANRFRMKQSMAQIEQNVAQSLASGAAGAAVAFTSGAQIDTNTDNMWLPANPTRLVAQVNGRYSMAGMVTFPNQANGAGLWNVFFRRGGASSLTPQQQLPYPVSAGFAILGQALCGPQLLSSGDYVELMAAQTTGAAQVLGFCSFSLIYSGE